MEICRLYVSYVRRVNDVITGGEMARGVVIKAFDFAISQVGIDLTSGSLWNDYLDFLKSWTPAATWEQQQKVDLIRKVYKRLLVIPTENIETLWSQYTKWENEVNTSSASKFISEKSAEFMLARSWNTEWHNITKKQLIRDVIPFGVRQPAVQKQLSLWYQWIELEKKNNLELKSEALDQRIEYVLKQAVISLPFLPELWFKYCKFKLANNDEANLNACIDILNESINLNPKSLLLNFQLAELYERDNNYTKSEQVYNKLIDLLVKDHNTLSERINALEKKPLDSTNELYNNSNEDDQDDEMQDIQDGNGVEINVAHQLSEEERNTLDNYNNEKNELNKTITLACVRLMMACKRFEGIKMARKVFKDARQKFPSIGQEFYVQNALMEHYSDNKKTALKIFGLAFKIFSTDGEFLLSYLDYLVNSNDVDNIRKLIQSSDSNITKEITNITEELNKPNIDDYTKLIKTKELQEKKYYLKKLFKNYITYALNYLSLDVAYSFANKCEQLFPDDDPIDLFSDRYRIGKHDLIKRIDLGQEDASYEESQPSKKRKVVIKEPETIIEKVNIVDSRNVNSTMGNGLPSSNSVPDTGFIESNIYNLLKILPNASYFGNPSEHVFNNQKLVELFSNLPNVSTD